MPYRRSSRTDHTMDGSTARPAPCGRLRRMSADPVARTRPHPLGVRLCDGGAEVAVLAAHAEGVWFCVLDPGEGDGWIERQVELTSRTHGVWHGSVPDVAVGA